MTVPRNPIADCVLAMIGQLGEARVIEATGKSVNAIRKSSNPNEPGRAVALADLIALAAACEAAGLPHTVEDALKAEIRIASMRFARTTASGDPLTALCRVSAEIGDVNRVVVEAMADGKLEPHEIRQARREIDEGRRALDKLDAVLEARTVPARSAA